MLLAAIQSINSISEKIFIAKKRKANLENT